MKKFGKILAALLSVCCMVSMASCGLVDSVKEKVTGPQGAQGEQGVQGEAGISAFDSFKAWYKETYESDYTGTEEDWLNSIINPTHNYEAIPTMIQMETTEAEGYGYYKCMDEGCNHAEFIFTDPVQVTELTVAGEAQTPDFYTFTQGAAGRFTSSTIITVDTTGIKVPAQVYELTFTGLPMVGVQLSIGQAEPVTAEGGTCVLEVAGSSLNGQIVVNIQSMNPYLSQNVKVSIAEPAPKILVVGDNTVKATQRGVEYEFSVAGTYTITFDGAEAFITDMITYDSGISSGHQFTVKEGQTYVFAMMPYDQAVPSAEYNVTIAAAPATDSGESAE